MTEKQKILIELEIPFCDTCPFLYSSDTGQDCNILRTDIHERELSNIGFQFDEDWRYKNCPLLHDEYLCRFCGIKVIMND